MAESSPAAAKRAICVFCASSSDVAATHLHTAAAVGQAMVARRWRLVYGGSDLGLMGAVAGAVHAGGGEVLAVIPKLFHGAFANPYAGESLITEDMAERKRQMIARADAFLVLPGGYGTLDELFEIIALKQLGVHALPIVLLNADGFYDDLLRHLERSFRDGFIRAQHRDLFTVAKSVDEVFVQLPA